MSLQSNDGLRVCNVKMNKFLPGRIRGTCTCVYGLQGSSINRFEFFSSLDHWTYWVQLLRTLFGQNQLDLDGAHGSMDASWIWANIAWGSILIGLMDSLA